jgi:hypothetical protein
MKYDSVLITTQPMKHKSWISKTGNKYVINQCNRILKHNIQNSIHLVSLLMTELRMNV